MAGDFYESRMKFNKYKSFLLEKYKSDPSIKKAINNAANLEDLYKKIEIARREITVEFGKFLNRTEKEIDNINRFAKKNGINIGGKGLKIIMKSKMM